jgi:SAM-dependent methyltransferase
MTENKDHWYDGWIYDLLIAPHQDRLFCGIRELIQPGASVVDIGCGTGRLPFFLSGHCRSVLGLDLSKRNIDRAQLLLSRKPRPNVSLRHAAAGTALSGGKEHYDYAVMTYVLHEVGPRERVGLMLAALRAADTLIIGDYPVPVPGGFDGALIRAVEFAAGAGHYENYKDFVRTGGIRGLAAKAGLKIVREIKGTPTGSHLAVLTV